MDSHFVLYKITFQNIKIAKNPTNPIFEAGMP
jgi:hypothetical protein